MSGYRITVVAVPAAAQDPYPYIGIEAGVVLPQDFNTDIADIDDASETSSDPGWEAAGVVGYDWGAIRTELEVSHRRWDTDKIEFASGVFPTLGFAPGPVAFEYDGDIRLTSLMANALFDFGGDEGIGFSIGAGAGRTFLGIDTDAAYVGPALFDTDDNQWAWQGIAQTRFPISQSVALSAKYRYFSTLEFELDDNRGNFNEFELSSHSALVGLVFSLGGKPAIISPPAPAIVPRTAPPPPPPPSPPAAVGNASCNTGPYIAFFGFDSSTITPEAASVLNTAVSAYRDCGAARVMLAGHADRSGSQSYNERLSERRNEAVRGYLTARGVPSTGIMSDAFGESRPRVPTADGVREVQNRRVEVSYGPGSGN